MPSPNKTLATKILIQRQCPFEDIASKLNVALATAEIYTIDGYCSGAPLAFKDLATKNLAQKTLMSLFSSLKKKTLPCEWFVMRSKMHTVIIRLDWY